LPPQTEINDSERAVVSVLARRVTTPVRLAESPGAAGTLGTARHAPYL
jgi:hypothetical protein